MKPIIEASGLGKRYKIGGKQSRYLSLRDSLSSMGRQLLGQKKESFWALEEVSFEVYLGECLGVIGRNGAGKSTLLKILAQITPPTKGSVKMRGRVASLLEVGTGFHPELTGRENIYLNGSILGMKRQEINKEFDEIVEFSGVERFLDTPLKHFSSGMQLRLAFAVAAHLNPEILLIDEVLAVGDAAFQKKCLGKMDEVSKSGRTVLFVSHNLGAVKRLCSRGVLLDNGKVKMEGRIEEVVEKYREGEVSASKSKWIVKNKSNIFIDSAEISINTQNGNTYLIVKTSISSRTSAPSSFIAFNVNNNVGTSIFQAIPNATPFINHFPNKLVTIVSEIDINHLIPGDYTLSIWIGSNYDSTYDWQREILSFSKEESPIRNRTYSHSADHGYIIANSRII